MTPASQLHRIAALTQAPIVAHFNLELRARVETDASRVELAGTYSQLQADKQ